MSTKPKRSKVKRDGRETTVYPTRLRGVLVWRFGWKDSSGKRRQSTFRTKNQAEDAAREKLGEQAVGGLAWSELPEDDRRWLEAVHKAARREDRPAVMEFIESRQRSMDLEGAVSAFLQWKEAAKGSVTAHLAQMRRDLEALVEAMPRKMVTDVSVEDLKGWWESRSGSAGKHRKQGIRRTLVSFWRWARKEGLAGNDPATVAERLPSLSLGSGRLRVLDAAELETLLRHVDEEWLPWVIFGAFSGMRPEEIAPKGSKPGLCWEHVDWRFNVIRLPAEVSKVRRARIIPLLPAARCWLESLGVTEMWAGPVCLRNPAEEGETLRLGKVLDHAFGRTEGWPKDALRHSYGSYRNATLRNLSQVAEEMGTSETMLHRHYHNPKTEEEGGAWFAVDPAIRFDTISGGRTAIGVA